MIDRAYTQKKGTYRKIELLYENRAWSENEGAQAKKRF